MVVPGIIFWLAVFAAIVEPVVGLGLLLLSLILAAIELVVKRAGEHHEVRIPSAEK
ncbi:MAG: hypothetical protein R3312_03230 [Gammaproteobacteria bacterium]|nr:hypothetical protein [Gammaproteobacteria bacterium]